MTFVPFDQADQIADRFLALLDRHGISPPRGSTLEGELLSVSELLEVAKNPNRYGANEQVDVLRAAAGIHDLAAKVLSVEPLPEFSSFIPHLKLIASGRTASLGQNASSPASDDTARKIAELYLACLAAHIGTSVNLDSPTNAKGDNPDVLFDATTGAGITATWALAIKTVSSTQGQTIFERIEEAARQINRKACPAHKGLIVINAKSALNHDLFWATRYQDLEDAKAALRNEVHRLIAAAEQDRDLAEWTSVFSGRAVRPALFMAQTLVSLPTPAGSRTPTSLKMLFAHSFSGSPDAEGLAIGDLLNGHMQSILNGNPGGPGHGPN